jgi:hypothetical protein
MSRDPLTGNPKDPASLHKYLYAGGDPVNVMDPTGREASELFLAFAVAVYAAKPVYDFAICLNSIYTSEGHAIDSFGGSYNGHSGEDYGVCFVKFLNNLAWPFPRNPPWMR